MNSEERKVVRTVLVAEGFRRFLSTRDYGEGDYTEYWTNDHGDHVTLTWAPRT